MGDSLLGLDVGSREIRASVIPADGGSMSSAGRSWPAKASPRAGFFAFDMDLASCWLLLTEAVQEAMFRAKVSPSEILGVAASGMRFSLVLLDDDGEPLYAVPNKDARAAEQAIQLNDDRGASLRRRTGCWPTPIHTAPRLAWIASHAPELAAKASCAFSLSDWIGYRLCGARLTNPSLAGETLLLDLENTDWAWDLVDQLGIPRRLVPDVMESGTRIGGLLPGPAEALGLLAGTPVVMGGADTQCGLLGLGATAPGCVGIIAGSTAPLQLVLDSPSVGEESRLWTCHHSLPRRWVLENNSGPLGEALEWFAAALYAGASDPVGRLVAEAARARVGADGMAFSTSAKVMSTTEMSLPVNTLSFSQLKFGNGGTPRERLGRAVLEGVAHDIKENLSELTSVFGRPDAEIRIAGGMTRSKLWTQMLCDVLGRPILVSLEPMATALGAAVCAGTGVSIYGGLEEGSARLARLEQLTPGAEPSAQYQQLCAEWGRLRRARAATDPLAAGIALQQMMDRPADSVEAWGRLSRPLRILATADLDAEALRGLRKLGHVDHESYRDALRLLAGDELVEALAFYDVLITEVDMVDAESLLRLPDLRVVAACRGNAVNVDVAACTALGIPVLGAPGRNAEAVADLTLAFMLMLARKLVGAASFLRRPGGEAGDMGRLAEAHTQLQGQELGKKVVGLIGFGSVARAVVRRLHPFGSRVLAYDPHVDAHDIRAEGAEPATLEHLLEASDFVSLHATVTDETRSLLNGQRIALMKPGAYLINTARGALVDEGALVAALQSGRLAGAGLDVFALEPPSADHPLLGLPNVIATPHIAGNTVDVAGHQGRLIVDDLRRLVEGERPHHALNPEVLSSFRWHERRPVIDPGSLASLTANQRPIVTDLQRGTAPAAVQAAGAVPAEPIPRAGASGSGNEKGLGLVLESFVERIVADEALQAFARKHTVSSSYLLSDIGLQFHLGFRDGKVSAGVGTPPDPPDVRLKGKAENLDAILTGRLGGNRAAMTGKLSFSGDIRLAMQMQKIQPDLIRLYSAARHEIGGIDFSNPPAPDGETPPDPGSAAGVPVGQPGHYAAAEQPVGLADSAAPPPGPAVSAAPQTEPSDPADVQALRQEMTRITQELTAAGLITATGGNVSVRVPGTSEVLITPSQLYKGELAASMMVRIDLEGNSLDADALAPSSERQIHCEIYKARPDVEAVIHSHASYATVLTMAGIPFLPVSTEAAFLGEVPRVRFAMPGSSELAASVRKALGEGMAVFMQNHGVVVAASSLRHAASTTEVIERTAQMIWACYALKKKPPVLPKEILELLREIGQMIA